MLVDLDVQHFSIVPDLGSLQRWRIPTLWGIYNRLHRRPRVRARTREEQDAPNYLAVLRNAVRWWEARHSNQRGSHFESALR